MTGFNLISDAERDSVVEAIRRRGATGQLTAATVAELIARAQAAQTHAGLDSLLLELPPETEPTRRSRRAPKRRRSVPKPKLPSLPKPKLSSIPPQFWLLALPAAFIVLMATAKSCLGGAETGTTEPQRPPEATASTSPPSTAPQGQPLGPGQPVDGGILRRVGDDIQPGRYMADGIDVCHWERVWAFDGTRAALIETYRKSGPRHIVDVVRSDAGFITSEGCGEWRPYEPLPTPLSEFGDGDWLVGEDVEPSIYEAPGDTQDGICVWSRGEDFSRDEVLQHVITDRKTSATLGAGERFSTRGCGIWTKVG